MSIKTEIQDSVLDKLQQEFSVAVRNHADLEGAWDEYYDMLHCIRAHKPNEWESDIYLPEFVSRILTQVGNFVSQYFSSRDYVESDIESDMPEDVAEARAAKKLLNRILNDPDTHYYHKIVRLLMFCFPGGSGIIKGGYEQVLETYEAGEKVELEYVTDDDGNWLAEDDTVFGDSMTQRPKTREVSKTIWKERIVKDMPTFDVYPRTSVYMSPEYTYSLKDKEYIYFEAEKSLDELKDLQEANGYFNLDILEEITSTDNKDFRNKNTGKIIPKEVSRFQPDPKFDVLERFGKFPTMVTEYDNLGNPKDGKPGYDAMGNLKKGAKNVECVITTVRSQTGDSIETMIGFKPSPFTHRPVVRFLCYIDPLSDDGFGDGEVTKELQKAINDTFNLSNYRTKLATTPAFKGRKFSGIDENIKITPEKVILVENPDELVEFQISDNVNGAMNQHGMLTQGMNFVMATGPNSMGQPTMGSRETATEASIIQQQAAIRVGMKSMNLEFIGFAEFYQMILNLCNDFMLPETLQELIGEDAQFYNPKRKDKFKPVSQALETEESKMFKARMIDQMMGRVAQIPNPKTPQVINYLMGMFMDVMGGDFKHFKKFMFEDDQESVLLYQLMTGSPIPQQSPNMAMGGGPQNQQGNPQRGPEQAMRANAPRQ